VKVKASERWNFEFSFVRRVPVRYPFCTRVLAKMRVKGRRWRRFLREGTTVRCVQFQSFLLYSYKITSPRTTFSLHFCHHLTHILLTLFHHKQQWQWQLQWQPPSNPLNQHILHVIINSSSRPRFKIPEKFLPVAGTEYSRNRNFDRNFLRIGRHSMSHLTWYLEVVILNSDRTLRMLSLIPNTT
jgi:hypothetical protein